MSQPPASTAAGEPVLVTGGAAFLEHAVRLVEAARLELVICSAMLDRRVYGDETFIDRVRRFVLQHRRARLRVLVGQPQAAMRASHRLVELGRALSSRIEFRQPAEERQLPADEYLIADERVQLIRATPEQLEARYFADAPMAARLQLRVFNALWEEAVPAREFSELRI